MRTKFLVCCCLALVTGCGASGGGAEPTAGVREVSSQRPQTAASYPALLKDRHRLSVGDAAFVARVPSAVRPIRGSAVRVPTPPGAIGRYWLPPGPPPPRPRRAPPPPGAIGPYWLAPWPHRPRPGRPSFCLYSAGPGDTGPATQCFDA